MNAPVWGDETTDAWWWGRINRETEEYKQTCSHFIFFSHLPLHVSPICVSVLVLGWPLIDAIDFMSSSSLLPCLFQRSCPEIVAFFNLKASISRCAVDLQFGAVLFQVSIFNITAITFLKCQLLVFSFITLPWSHWLFCVTWICCQCHPRLVPRFFWL